MDLDARAGEFQRLLLHYEAPLRRLAGVYGSGDADRPESVEDDLVRRVCGAGEAPQTGVMGAGGVYVDPGQNTQFRLAGRVGSKPPATDSKVLTLPGAYLLNPFLVRVELVPMTVVQQGEVAVVMSYVGLPTQDTSGDDFKFGSIVQPGHKGYPNDVIFAFDPGFAEFLRSPQE